MTSCMNNQKVIDIPTQYLIDSISYHPPSLDNTLQVSPYWKIHLNGTDVWIKSNIGYKYKKGDTITVIVRQMVK
jgi:hypothetical protein